MTGILSAYVIDNVWCAPGQDQELVVKPKRLHADTSIFRSLFYLKRNIDLPDIVNNWFVYQIGTYYESGEQLQLYQHTWEYEQWTPISKSVTLDNLVTTVFTAKGITFPLFRTFYMFTKEKALLIAVQNNNRIPADLRNEELYIRFYKNAFRDSARAVGTDYSMKTEGTVLSSANDINTVNARVSEVNRSGGYCTLSVNGQRYKTPQSSFVSAGDVVEWVWDPTIDYVQSYPLSTARTYSSSLDGESKIVLHSGSKNYFNTIAYQDDLEIEMFTRISSQSYYGAYVPLFDTSTLRMLTHRDYGLRSSVSNLIKESITLLNPSGVTTDAMIEIKFRKSGFDRPIIKTSSRITDLYTLQDAIIPAALSQPHSSPFGHSHPLNFDNFDGPTLENSNYIKAMSADQSDITEAFAKVLLGYNCISLLRGTLATQVTNNAGVKTVPVPLLYQAGFTAYEYNANGQFLGFHTGQGTDTYQAVHVSCNIVELLTGIADTGPSARYGDNNITFDPTFSYRVWACPKDSGIPTFNWVDITDTTDYVANTTTGIISWSNPSDPRYMMVRDDSKFTFKSFSQQFNSNLLTFEITEFVDKGLGGGLQSDTADVASSDITLFMNSRSLARGVDYFVDFPNVYITNFNYLNQDLFSVPQNFHYRSIGLGNKSGQLQPALSSGAVSHGFVGTDGKYVPKNDKLVRVTIDGYLKLPGNIRYSQDLPDVQDPNNAFNGLTYEVKDHEVSITSFIEENQEPMRLLAKQEDASLVTYISAFIEQPSRGPETLPAPTRLICPFHSKIVDDLLSGVLTSTDTDPSNTDFQIRASVQPYLKYITVSPCQHGTPISVDPHFRITPHASADPISLGDSDSVTFIARVSQLLFPNVITNIRQYFL